MIAGTSGAIADEGPGLCQPVVASLAKGEREMSCKNQELTLFQELLGQMQEQLGAEHYGAERQETVEMQAEGVVAEELNRRRRAGEELERHAKADTGKVAIALRLRAQT